MHFNEITDSISVKRRSVWNAQREDKTRSDSPATGLVCPTPAAIMRPSCLRTVCIENA